MKYGVWAINHLKVAMEERQLTATITTVCISMYCMFGNFYGVQIFMDFVGPLIHEKLLI